MIVRTGETTDRDAVVAVALATGNDGADAAPLHRDGDIVGLTYAVPYLVFEPSLFFVAEDADGVGGYVCGAVDTRTFEARLEHGWWPALRARYPEPANDPGSWDADARRRFAIHHPVCAPGAVVEDHPAHLHMNLLPRLQGRGIGTRLLETWCVEAKRRRAPAAHIATGPSNARAFRFWQARGFRPILEEPAGAGRMRVWCGRRL